MSPSPAEKALHRWGHAAVKGAPRLTRETECELFEAWRERRDARARSQLARANMGCVMKLAHRARRKARAVPLEDIVAAGYEGLLAAIDRFDHGLDVRFVGFAEQWIFGAMLRFAEHARRADLPVSMADVPSEEPSPEEDALEGEQAAQAKQRLARALAKLSPRERLVVESRMRALDHESHRPTRASAKALGVSCRRARAIEQVAMSKLRRALRPTALEGGT